MQNPGQGDGVAARPDDVDKCAGPAREPTDAPAGRLDDAADDIAVDAADDETLNDGLDDGLVDTAPDSTAPENDIADEADPGLADLRSTDVCPADADAETSADDCLLFDPLLCDEPIDLAAVRADDALIDALGSGDLATARTLIDDDDPLIAMLASWAAAARTDPDEQAAPAVGGLLGDSARRTHLAVVPALPNGAGSEPSTAEQAQPVAAEQPPGKPADDGEDTGTALRPAVGWTDRARSLGRRIPRGGHPLLQRAAVVAIATALAGSAAAAEAASARPGDTAWPITRVFFAERARSIEAAEVVATGLQRAHEALARQQPVVAARELDSVEEALTDVGDQDGHDEFVSRQRELARAVAGTGPTEPPPRDPPSTSSSDSSALAAPLPAPESSDTATTDADIDSGDAAASADTTDPTDASTGGSSGGSTTRDGRSDAAALQNGAGQNGAGQDGTGAGPGITAPDTSTPGTTTPGSTAPETTAPDTSTSDTTTPDTSSPDTTAPDPTQSSSTSPATSSPDTGTPTGRPDAAASNNLAPGAGTSTSADASRSTSGSSSTATSSTEATESGSGSSGSSRPDAATASADSSVDSTGVSEGGDAQQGARSDGESRKKVVTTVVPEPSNTANTATSDETGDAAADGAPSDRVAGARMTGTSKVRDTATGEPRDEITPGR
ncbi:MAG: hypothetical protein K0R87_1409 [Pseudonocardia sp.]|nr:hypothetical protein [Pseudonocardia sp.]